MPLRNVATNYTFEQQRQEINLLAADVDSLSTTLTNQQATETTDSPSFNNLYLGSVIYGPSIFTIDPATHGDDTGTLVVKGNLQIDGTTTTVNSTTMSVNDLNITLADGAANAAAANGAGITVDGAGATLLYNGSTDEWAFNKSLTSLSVSGTSTFNASPLGAANVGVLIDGASGAVVTAATGTNSLFKGFTQGTNTATVNIKANGSAEFASGNLFLNFVSDGANVVARNDSTNNPVYEVYKGGLTANDRTVRINSDGSSMFSKILTIGATASTGNNLLQVVGSGTDTAFINLKRTDGASDNTSYGGMNVVDNNGVTIGIAEWKNQDSTTRSQFVLSTMNISTNNLAERLRIKATGDVLPGANATQNIGSTNLRWATVYSAGLSVVSGSSNIEFRSTNTQSTNTNKAFTINNNDQTSGLDISYRGEILPKQDANVNLGGPSNRWANIYSADLQLSNEGAANDVDGTWGQYTIQEGEHDLFLINRRSGKKYKFMLQEVQ